MSEQRPTAARDARGRLEIFLRWSLVAGSTVWVVLSIGVALARVLPGYPSIQELYAVTPLVGPLPDRLILEIALRSGELFGQTLALGSLALLVVMRLVGGARRSLGHVDGSLLG